jgi:uncharacterized membrane protein YcaP (DUF421 family)
MPSCGCLGVQDYLQNHHKDKNMLADIDWKAVLISDLDLTYAIEILIRTMVMFAMVLLFLRMSGKKGVRQLSIFEVAIIITLGSAAGDPMFNKDIAILPSILVFGAILGVYRLLTFIAAKSERFESVLEGDPMYIIEDGMFTMQEEHSFAKDEFFAEMRAEGIEHVGQVRTALLETNGTVSFYYFSDEEVRPGLPILPKPYNKRSKSVSGTGKYACTFCANVVEATGTHECPRCKHDEWVAAINTTRLT